MSYPSTTIQWLGNVHMILSHEKTPWKLNVVGRASWPFLIITLTTNILLRKFHLHILVITLTLNHVNEKMIIFEFRIHFYWIQFFDITLTRNIWLRKGWSTLPHYDTYMKYMFEEGSNKPFCYSLVWSFWSKSPSYGLIPLFYRGYSACNWEMKVHKSLSLDGRMYAKPLS